MMRSAENDTISAENNLGSAENDTDSAPPQMIQVQPAAEREMRVLFERLRQGSDRLHPLDLPKKR
jgi:hypothetical protein